MRDGGRYTFLYRPPYYLLFTTNWEQIENILYNHESYAKSTNGQIPYLLMKNVSWVLRHLDMYNGIHDYFFSTRQINFADCVSCVAHQL